MSEDPNHDAAALAASESKTQSTGGTLGKKHKNLIIFLILVIAVIGPLAGVLTYLYYW
jgi:hypothetical protein